ncbi:MAG: hypothetical protein NT062_12225, partial [Proteobacteria bacterium]|nr:hypothetical protein [Pseudomonadota bacterium]
MGADRGGELHPVELRHVEVEDREIEGIAARDPCERLARARGRGDRDLPLLELELEDAQVRRVVVDDEHALAGEGHEPGLVALGNRADLAGDRELERRADADLAGDGHLAVHELDEPLADREPETGAAVEPRRRRVDLGERAEQPVDPIRGDADASVAHADPQGDELAVGDPVDGDEDVAPLGELHRVRQQVEQHLPDAPEVAADPERGRRIDEVRELEPLRRRGRRDQVERGLDALAQVERMELDLELARLDLREVEDVVDDRQQVIAARPDGLDEVALAGVERGVEQQAAHADDGVHRRPDLVAHRREERRLRAHRGLRGLARLLQLGGAQADPLVDLVLGGAELVEVALQALAVVLQEHAEVDHDDREDDQVHAPDQGGGQVGPARPRQADHHIHDTRRDADPRREGQGGPVEVLQADEGA